MSKDMMERLVDPAELVIIGLDTQDGSEHPRFDERATLPIDEHRVANVMEFGINTAVTAFPVGGKLEIVFGRQRTKWARAANEKFAKMKPASRVQWLADHPDHPHHLERVGDVVSGIKVLVPVLVKVQNAKSQYASIISENECRSKDTAMGLARKMENFVNICVAESQDPDIDSAWAEAYRQAALAFGCSPAKVKQYGLLLDLDPAVQAKVEAGELAMYEVLGLRKLPKEKQAEVAEKKATNKKEGKKEKLEGDKSRQLRAPKRMVEAVGRHLGGTAQLALLWAIGEIDEAAAMEDAGFAKAMAGARKK